MDFYYSPKEEAFRQEVKDWLAVHMKELPNWWRNPEIPGPEIDSEEYHQFSLWWHKKLYDAGFVGIAWPKEYGGRGATVLEQVVYNEEMAKARAPGGANGLGIGWAGPTIMEYGTEEQKKRFLPKILSAEEYWCQGFSEPEAGSDLANVQTRAVEDGDYYIVNGQKVWTTGGHYADWAILLVRTDPKAPKHKGLTYLLLDMHLPGVTVRPLRQITGHAEFNEVFLDNVRIPKSLQIGETNRGWYIAVGTLAFERSALATTVQRENTLKDIIAMARKMEQYGRPVISDPLIRQKLAQFYIDISVLKYTGLRSLTGQLRGERPGPEVLVVNLFGTELNLRMDELAMQLQGPYSRLMRGSKYAVENGEWQFSFLGARGTSIASGTLEIKRNVIAERGLGLPRATR
jgi:alkylation response protein AidB-like acyl-CoA dehydrogenase